MLRTLSCSVAVLCCLLSGHIHTQAQTPDSIINENNAAWKVLLSISDKPFTDAQVRDLKKTAGKPVHIYKDKKGQYRAMVDTPRYWFRSVRYRDSLISAGISEAALIKVYADRFTIRYWGTHEDIGVRVDSLHR